MKSNLWLNRQLKDQYVKKAKNSGFLSRAAYKLLDEGQAYFCYCNSEELVKAREVHSKHHSNLGYRDNCYNLGEDEILWASS